MTTPITQLYAPCKECGGRGYHVSGVRLGLDWFHEKVECHVCEGRKVLLNLEAWAQSRASRWAPPSKRGRT